MQLLDYILFISLLVSVQVLHALPNAIKASRIIAIGDIHGDIEVTRRVLMTTGIINQENKWIGGQSIVIFNGAICDRAAHTKQVFDLIISLKRQAKQVLGSVIVLLGHHELMNMKDLPTRLPPDAHPFDAVEYGGLTARKEAFSAQGKYGMLLRASPLAVKIENNIFVQGGISAAIAKKYGSIHAINKQGYSALKTHNWNHELFNSSSGPFLYKGFSSSEVDDMKKLCNEVAESLRILGAHRMIMGHSIMKDGLIHSRCDGKVLLIDLGMSEFFFENRYNIKSSCGALEISGNSVTAVYCDKHKPLALAMGATPTRMQPSENEASLSRKKSNSYQFDQDLLPDHLKGEEDDFLIIGGKNKD